MAVERTGTAVTVDNAWATSGSQSITVPTCDCAVLFYVGSIDGTADTPWDSGGASFTLGGSPLVWRGRTPNNSIYMDAAVYTLLSPASGSQTFAWSGCTNGNTQSAFVLVFYNGVDPVSPVVGVSGASGTQSISGLTAPSGSMTVLSSQTQISTSDASGSGQTLIVDNFTAGQACVDVAERAEATSMSATGGGYPSVLAIVLAGISGSLTQHSFRLINDDGDEDASTFAALLNADVTLPAGSVVRFRALVDATGDLSGKQFQLEYSRRPSGGSFGSYKKVN